MSRQRFPEGEARTEKLFTQMRPAERAALDAVAEGQCRSRSSVIRAAVLQYTRQHQADNQAADRA